MGLVPTPRSVAAPFLAIGALITLVTLPSVLGGQPVGLLAGRAREIPGVALGGQAESRAATGVLKHVAVVVHV
jgi:hypothetical protein